MIRIVKVVFEESEYEGTSTMLEEFVTVETEDESQIYDKVYEHFNNKSDPYGTFYTVYRVEVLTHIS